MTHSGGSDDSGDGPGTVGSGSMRISGSVASVGGVGRSHAADAVAPADAAGDAGAVAPVDANPTSEASAAIDAIAHDLASGAIDADVARTRLIDAMVGASVPPGSDPAWVADVRAEVEALLHSDPQLRQLLA